MNFKNYVILNVDCVIKYVLVIAKLSLNSLKQELMFLSADKCSMETVKTLSHSPGRICSAFTVYS